MELGTDFKIIFVGIEPKTMDWGNAPTPNVQKAADEFIKTLKGRLLMHMSIINIADLVELILT